MPNIEFIAAWREPPDRTAPGGGWLPNPDGALPHEVWKMLSPYGQNVMRKMHAPPGVWPKGAGVFHPVFEERNRLVEDERATIDAQARVLALWEAPLGKAVQAAARSTHAHAMVTPRL